MIVWLASYPRSGNGFVRATMHSCCNVQSVDRYKIGKPFKNLNALFLEWLESFETLVVRPETFVVKTHDLPEHDRFPTIYLVRDGRDCMVSYAWFHLTCDQGLDSAQVTATRCAYMSGSRRFRWFAAGSGLGCTRE